MAALGKAVEIARRVRAFITRGRRDDDLREEIESHIDARRLSLIHDGVDPRDAAYQARRMFGNPTAIRDDARDTVGMSSVEAVGQDVRFGWRLIVRSPLFTFIVVLSLSTSIAAAVAVFTVADAVLFRRLAVRTPGELRAFRADVSFGAATKTMHGVDDETFPVLQKATDFADLFAFRAADEVVVDGRQDSGLARVHFVSGNYFEVLGVSAARGRLLSDVDRSVDPIPVVITDRLWRSGFATDDDALGRTVMLNGHAAVIIGVVRTFEGMAADRPADVFAPLQSAVQVDPAQSNKVMRLVGRLHAGISIPLAEERLRALYLSAGPAMFKNAGVRVSLEDASRGFAETRDDLARPLWLGLALVAVVMLVACANTGGLLLSRFAARRGEFGVRVALGAGRVRLARQLFLEALLLAGASAAVGLIVGRATAPLLVALMPAAATGGAAFDLRLDGRLIAFTAILSSLAACGAVAASLLRLWRTDASALLSSDSRAVVSGTRRLTSVLIAAQVGCSLVLVVGAVSMGQTLLHLQRVSPGFDPDRTFTVTVDATGLVPRDAAAEYHGRLHDRIVAAPGVLRATLAQLGPLTSASTVGSVDVVGGPPVADADRMVRMFFVGPDYFETLGMPLLAGRGITGQDTRGRVAVVNDRFATFFFGTPAAALGRIVNKDVRIVGVAADAHYSSPRDDVPRAMFVPYTPMQRTQMTHLVRASADRPAAMRAVREAISSYDARLRPKMTTSEDLVAAAVVRERFFSVIAVTVSALALLLAAAGLYAAVAYAVSQRRAEIAVRLALGASSRDILMLVMRDPFMTTLTGVALGVPGAYIVMRAAASLLFGVAAFEPVTVAACGVALTGIAVCTAAVAARRAIAVDPIDTLRNA